MKNLIPDASNTIDTHKRAVNRKNASEIKNKLLSIEDDVLKDYKKYDDNFNTNTLESLANNDFYKTYSDELLSLYDYTSKTIKELRSVIEELQPQSIRTTCQYCTVDSVGSMDHILPKEEFPEFVVNPKNLFPACPICNQHRGKRWRGKDGEKLFLNLYLDILPEEQYLFVRIEVKDDNVDFKFELDDKNLINKGIFKLLNSHYTKLYLTERIRLKSNDYFTEFKTYIKSMRAYLSDDQIKNIILSSVEESKKAYGNNHWKYILQASLIQDSKFWALM